MNELFGIALVFYAGIFAIGVLALLVWSLVWVYRDAEARGKSGWLVSLLVLIVKWPVSLLLWIAIRPDPVIKSAKAVPRA